MMLTVAVMVMIEVIIAPNRKKMLCNSNFLFIHHKTFHPNCHPSAL